MPNKYSQVNSKHQTQQNTKTVENIHVHGQRLKEIAAQVAVPTKYFSGQHNNRKA